MAVGDLSGRSILITGGTAGIGLEAAREAHQRGAELILGTRDPEHFEQVRADLGERVHPFVADLVDDASVDAALERLEREALRPTDVIHSAAGGLETLLQDMVRIALGLRKLRGAEFDAAHREGVRELRQLALDALPRSMEVNHHAPSRFLQKIVPTLPAGASVGYYTHFWGSLFPHPQVPAYYGSIAESKHVFESWLEQRAGGWATQGVTTYVLSTSVISDTRMGHLLDRYCATLMPAENREKWRATFVDCREVALVTLDRFFGSNSPEADGLRRLFITRSGTTTDTLLADDPVMSFPVALAANAPLWADEVITSRN